VAFDAYRTFYTFDDPPKTFATFSLMICDYTPFLFVRNFYDLRNYDFNTVM
jgi:hypothetical protein